MVTKMIEEVRGSIHKHKGVQAGNGLILSEDFAGELIMLWRFYFFMSLLSIS